MQRVCTAYCFPGLIEWVAQRAGSDTHPSNHGDYTAGLILLGRAHAPDADCHPRRVTQRLNQRGKPAAASRQQP